MSTRHQVVEMNDTKSTNTWHMIAGISGILLWVAIVVFVVAIAVNGTNVNGTYVSSAGTIRLTNNGSALWTSDGSALEGRFRINADEITFKPRKGKATVFKRVEKNLRHGTDLYVKR
jgi:hypothetical protein